MSEEGEFVKYDPLEQQKALKNIPLYKKQKKLGREVSRLVNIQDGKIKQKNGSGGGCMGGPSGRVYDNVTKKTKEQKEKFKESWPEDASHKLVRYKIEFSDRSPVYLYFQDEKQAALFETQMIQNESALNFRTKPDQSQGEVRGSLKKQKQKNSLKDDAMAAFNIMKNKLSGFQEKYLNTNDLKNRFSKGKKSKKEKQKNISAQVITEDPKQDRYMELQSQYSGASEFKDQEFPPELKSLSSNVSEFPIASQVEWKRAKDFIKGDIKVFTGIEPNDIKQGQLGDCYFLCSLSALAERPNLITKLFKTDQYQENGLYCVQMFIDGEFQEIILDDYFPTKYNQPSFSRANGAELWVLLLEKAYAKAYGSYHNIEAGLTGSAIRDLTGAPEDYITTDEGVESVWNFISYHDPLGHIMTAGSNQGQTTKETDMGEGIVTGHAYAILDHKVVQTNRGAERIIQMRNPWGSKEWTGRWSDKSNAWTPQLKELCKVVDKDDGVFWIEVKDFCRQFDVVTTNLLDEDYQYSYKKVQMSNEQMVVVPFYVKEGQEGYISISQKDKRHYKNSGNYEYSLYSVNICKGDFSSYIGDSKSCVRDQYVSGQFEEGLYYAVVSVDWSKQTQNQSQFVISSYTSGEIAFGDVISDFNDANTILDKVLAVRPADSERQLHKFADDNDVSRLYGFAGGYLYFRYVNQSQSSTLRETIYMKSHKNLEICNPDSNSDQFSVQVKPGDVRIVKYKIKQAGRGGYSLSYSMSYRIELGEQGIVQKLLQQNPRYQKVQGQQSQVAFYYLMDGTGLYLYYVNKDSRTFKQNIELKLQNLKKEPDGINSVEIIIQPNQTKMIKCGIIDPAQNMGFGYSYINQWI